MSQRYKSPYKDISELISDVEDFLYEYDAELSQHSTRTGTYFEMQSFNNLIRYYRMKGYNVQIMNLKEGNVFRYKLSPRGYPENFSYFKVVKEYKYKNITKHYEYEIHHNLAIQSSHDPGIFVTPDISVIKSDKVNKDQNFYKKNGYAYVRNQELITFIEVKNFNPFPELLFNFIGIVNELHPSSFNQLRIKSRPPHLSPSLFISGAANEHSIRIKRSLEQRYNINIVCSLFHGGFASKVKKGLKSTGERIEEEEILNWLDNMSNEEMDENLYFNEKKREVIRKTILPSFLPSSKEDIF